MEINFRDSGGRAILVIEITKNETYSEGWLEAICNFNYDGFKAYFGFSLMVVDLAFFLNQIKTLNETLKGFANFSNTEDNVNLQFSTDGLGHILITGKLRHTTNPFLETTFEINSDQTFLPDLIKECSQVIERYKVE